MKKEVEFHSGNLILRGEIHLPGKTPAPGILICHAMHAEGFRWLPLYRIFAEAASERGFASLLFDFRGCGLSEGEFDYGFGEQEDARAAFRFLLSQEEVDHSCCFVLGRSLGGTTAIYALNNEPALRGYALWATPPDHHQNVQNFVIRKNGRFGYFAFNIVSMIDRFHDVSASFRLDLFGLRLRPKDLRGKLMKLKPYEVLSQNSHPPVLFLIGDRDEYVTLSEARNFEQLISEPKRLVILPETGHTFKGAEAQAVSLTLDWFKEI